MVDGDAAAGVPSMPTPNHDGPAAPPRYTLRVLSLRVVATVEAPLSLPPFIGSTLRGAFGHALREVACCCRAAGVPCEECVESRRAVAAPTTMRCVYGYLFETPVPPDAPMLERQAHAPRPFIIRPVAGDAAPPAGRGNRHYRPGQDFLFEVHLIGNAVTHCAAVVEACIRMGQRGLGDGHGRVTVREVTVQAPFEEGRCLAPFAALAAGLTPGDGWPAANVRAALLDGDRVRVRFLTPTTIVRGGAYVFRPGFTALIQGVCRRLYDLAVIHSDAAPGDYFEPLVARAQAIRLVSWTGAWQAWSRYSSRRDEHQPFFGGLVGEAVYEGDLRPFLPHLVFGQAIHVGKWCTFGAGHYRVEAVPDKIRDSGHHGT